ncbi:MAG: RNA polymerase factor sigma-32 [Candidatus Adiutrix sp.]|nr:RNA polymerase factor sigma-32 [Candidatus Adiutrix sp.]
MEAPVPARRTPGSPPIKKNPAGPPALKTPGAPPVRRKEPSPPALKTPAPPPAEREKAQPPASRTPAPPPVLRPPAAPPVTDPLRAYLAEVRRFKLLSREEEARWVELYKATQDPEAAHKIITSNLRLVVKIAMDFQSHWLNNLLDLIQEGNVGLMQALRKFDPGRGVKFSYYASYWIKAYILKYIMDNWRLVKVGTTQSQRKLFYNLRKERDRILKEGLTPAPRLLAERLGVEEGEVEEMDLRLSAGREISLDAPLGPDNDQTQGGLLPADTPRPDHLLAQLQFNELLKAKLDKFRAALSPRESLILEKRLLAETPVTLQEIGEEFGISRERVRQLEERLKKTLQVFLSREIPDLTGPELG